MKSPRLKTVLKGASAIGLVAVMTSLASAPALAQNAPDRVAQKTNDPRDHVRAANCVQSAHEGQARAAERVGAFTAYSCATQESDPDRAEDEVAEAFGTGTQPGGSNAGGNGGEGGGDNGGGDNGGGDNGGGDNGGGDEPVVSAPSSLIYLSLGEGPTDEGGIPALDSLAKITLGTEDPENAQGPALVDLRVGDGLIDDGAGGPGNLQITVLDAINGDGTDEGLTGTALDGVLGINADTPPGGVTPPENIDGLAEVNLGTDPDPEGFNAIQVNAFNDEIADIGHVTVADGWFDEGDATLPDGDLGSELVGIDLGEDPTGNENDNTAQVTLDNAGFAALGDALGINRVNVIDPVIGPDGPSQTNLATIDGNPDGGLAPLVDLFRPADMTDPGDGDGEEPPTQPEPVTGPASLLRVGVADAPAGESGIPDFDSLASVTIGSPGSEEAANQPAIVELGVGDGLLVGPEQSAQSLNITLLDALNGDGDSTGFTGTPLDGVLNVEGDVPTDQRGPIIDGLAEANLGSDPDPDGFNAVQVDAFDDTLVPLGHVTVADGWFDEGDSTLPDGDLGSELVGVDLSGDPTINENDNTAQVTLDNENLLRLTQPLGVDSANVLNPEYGDQRTVAELDGNPDGALAPVVDIFRPDALPEPDPEPDTTPDTGGDTGGDTASPSADMASSASSLSALPGAENLPETATLVSALPEGLRNITAIQGQGRTGTVSSDMANGGGEGRSAGGVVGTATGLVNDTLSTALGILGR